MKDEVLTEGDSSILRYIKTLTSHQTNAKQQRMDRYMQKNKRSSIKNVMPTGLSHQNVLKPKETMTLSKGNIPKQNAKLDNSKSIAPSALKEHEKETGPRKRLQSKHPYEEDQFRDKKRKKTKREKQVTTINSFDRFRFSKTSSPSKTPQYPAASNGNKVAKSTQPPRSKRESIGLPSVQVWTIFSLGV
ncbi:hypothetical protein P3T76_004510 [Phytophthora citrophthora]|uniref:Uncharacterized protein n=1 Tax=Phytophthora citrophthora TaxID=4793 RepID=A0AAD9GUZ7_9STRA|nr:hypothetical protein P3T76_004510 [Phytophthora citrophthora]